MRQLPLSNSDRLVLVDDEDYPVLSRITWALDKEGYARNANLRLHSLITGFQRERIVDHIDRNKLNNQKENLRLTTRQKNLMNRGAQRNNTSGFKGVARLKKTTVRSWQASITHNGKSVYIGRFATPEEAAHAYDRKASELFGEFAYFNFPATAAITSETTL